MTFAEMQAEVRRRLDESTSAFYTDGDVEDALNDALEEMSEVTEWYERQVTIPIAQERTYYDLRNLPEPFLSLRRCFNTTTNHWLEPTDPREMDYHTFRQWETTTGQPEKYFLRGYWWLGLWMRSTKDEQGLRIYYTAVPPMMVNDSDTPEFPREYHFGLIDYALSDLYAQEREVKKALKFWNQYKGYEEGLRQYVEGRQNIDRLRTV